jgi:hypothetical protein
MIASILSLLRIKLLAGLAHPVTAILLAIMVPGGIFLLTITWLYKRSFTAKATNQSE